MSFLPQWCSCLSSCMSCLMKGSILTHLNAFFTSSFWVFFVDLFWLVLFCRSTSWGWGDSDKNGSPRCCPCHLHQFQASSNGGIKPWGSRGWVPGLKVGEEELSWWAFTRCYWMALPNWSIPTEVSPPHLSRFLRYRLRGSLKINPLLIMWLPGGRIGTRSCQSMHERHRP